MFVCVYEFEYHMLPAPYMVFSLVGAQIYISLETVAVMLYFSRKTEPRGSEKS